MELPSCGTIGAECTCRMIKNTMQLGNLLSKFPPQSSVEVVAHPLDSTSTFLSRQWVQGAGWMLTKFMFFHDCWPPTQELNPGPSHPIDSADQCDGACWGFKSVLSPTETEKHFLLLLLLLFLFVPSASTQRGDLMRGGGGGSAGAQ